MNTENPCDFNHLILYAKHWYKRTDILEDIRIIMAERANIDREVLSDCDVWHLMVMAAFMHLPKRDLDDLFSRMFTSDDYRFEGVTNFCDMMQKILTKFAVLSIVNKEKGIRLELGKPDPKILPVIENAEEKWAAINANIP